MVSKSVIISLMALILASNIITCHSENILFFLGLASYSHRVAIWPLVEALAEKGHNVTFFFGQVPKTSHPKVTEFSADDMHNYNERLGLSELDMIKLRLTHGRKGIYQTWPKLIEVGVKMCEIILTDPNSLHLINNSKFDLVFVDALYNDCALGLAYKFQAKHILYDPTAAFMWYPDTFGYLDESSYYPEMQYAFNLPMSFVHRCYNSLTSLYWHYLRQYTMFPRLEMLFKTHLNLQVPSFEELQRNVSLVFIQRHFSDELPKALPPLFVQVGGLHLFTKANPLSEDIRSFVEDDASKGTIYISFGSFAKPESLPYHLKMAFVNTFKAFPKYKILWKYSGTELQDLLPPNVKTSSWFPQMDILNHPKTKLFVSHGGNGGYQEAIYASVPMVIMPIFAEQHYNSILAETKEIATILDIETVDQNDMQNAINEVISNPEYRENMDRISRLFKDRHVNPLDTAVWWTEYVLRHDEHDLSHLKSYGFNQTWYQRRLLDVWAFFGVLFLCTIAACVYVLKKTSYFVSKLRGNVGVKVKKN